MTEAMYYLMLALRSPAHGYRLMHAVSEISRGRVKMGPGTLYGLLGRMMEDSLVTMQEDGRRKIYALTEKGQLALQVEYGRLQAMVLDGILLKTPLPETWDLPESPEPD